MDAMIGQQYHNGGSGLLYECGQQREQIRIETGTQLRASERRQHAVEAILFTLPELDLREQTNNNGWYGQEYHYQTSWVGHGCFLTKSGLCTVANGGEINNTDCRLE